MASKVSDIVDVILEAREEFTDRGVSPGDALVIVGCALGTMLGGRR